MGSSTKKSVGYRRPPKDRQFKPGQSGNPKGRPKGSLNLGTLFTQALQQKVPVTENGKRRFLTKAELAVCQQANKAAQGDSKAFQTIAKIQQSLEGRHKQPADSALLPQSEITHEQCLEALRQWFEPQQTPVAPPPRQRTRIVLQKGQQS